MFELPPHHSAYLPGSESPGILILVDDFLSDNHIPTIIGYLEEHKTLTINIRFTQVLVREPFTMQIGMSIGRKAATDEQKIESIGSMFLQVNATIMGAVYTAGPILH